MQLLRKGCEKDMDQIAVEQAVNKIISDNSLDAVIKQCETDFDEGSYWHWNVEVEVSRQDYDKAIMLDAYCAEYSVRWRQRCPPLVGAELGNFVLIFSEHSSTDEESDVGLVSSKYVDEQGEVCYGCRYIRIGLNDSFADRHYDFEISQENYGGFPTGFLKVLTPEEVIQHLSRNLDTAFEKEKEAVQAKYENSVRSLPGVIDSLQNLKKTTCEKLEIEDYILYSCKIQK